VTNEILTDNLNKPFGPAITKGFLKLRQICRLRRWKYWAGVVGKAMCMLILADWSSTV